MNMNSGEIIAIRLLPIENDSFGVAVNDSGNAWIAGYTAGDLDGSSAGGNDAFLAKHDAGGNVLWTRQTGTAYEDCALGVAVDGSGNAWISGYTQGELGGSNPSWPMPVSDAFLARYDVGGNVVWTNHAGDPLTRQVMMAVPEIPIDVAEMLPGKMRVTWFGEVSYRYKLWRSADLINWTPVTVWEAGAGGTMSHVAIVGSGRQVFFRVERQRLSE